MKTLTGFAAFLTVVVPAALLADGPESLPSKFDASTGYVTMKVSDSAFGSRTKYAFCHNAKDGDPQPGIQGATGQWSEDAEKPHSGTNYYVGASMTLCTDNSQGGAYAFAGDKLVIANGAALQSMATGQNVATINSLYMIGGSKFTWSAQKNALHGTVYVLDSSATFVYFNIGYEGSDIQAFGMKLVGDANQQVFVSGSSKNALSTVDGVARSGHLDLEGDLSDYKGKILLSDTACVRIGTTMSDGSVAMYRDKRGGYFGTMPNKGDLAVNKIEAIRGMKVMASAGSTLTVKTLSMTAEDTLGVTWGAANDTPGKLVVNGFSGTWPSTIKVVAEGTPHGYRGEIIRIKAAALPEGGLAADRFALPAESMGVTYSVGQETETGDCVVSVNSREWVTHTATVTDASHKVPNDFTSPTNYQGKAFWSNGSCPEEDPEATEKIWKFPASVKTYPADAAAYPCDANGIYTIPSALVYLDSGADIEHFTTCSGLRANFVWNGINDNGNAGNSALKVTPPSGTGVTARNVFGYWGTILLLAGKSNSVLMYGSGLEMIAATLSGGGDLVLKSFPNAGAASTNDGWHEITGTNTEWTGTLKVTQAYEKKKYATQGIVTPNWDYHNRLIISDGRNLGGTRDTFAANALTVEHYAQLLIRDDVTLASDLNRGVTLCDAKEPGDVARFWQPDGKTLTVNQPIVLNGTLVKEGAGTLVLGGNGITAAAGSKIVITNGCLKVTNAAAADGVALDFCGSAPLLVVPGATAETALRMVKDGSSITASTQTGNIPIRLDIPERGADRVFEGVICTATRGNLRFGLARRRGYVMSVAVAGPDANGVYTYKAKAERMGLTLMVR